MHPGSPMTTWPRVMQEDQKPCGREGAAPRAAYPCWTMQPDSLALVPSLSPRHPLLTQPWGMVGLLCFLLSALDCPHVEILPESAGLTLPACAELRSCINPVMQITDGCTQACKSHCALGSCPRAVLVPRGKGLTLRSALPG